MNNLFAAIWNLIYGSWLRPSAIAWDRFWFTPSKPHTLALIRILGGGMLLYTHAVWSLGLTDFLGAKAWVTAAAANKLGQGLDGRNFTFSYLSYIESPALLWTLHLAALVVFALLTVGLYTRVVAPLAFVITVSYCHRLSGALFGLDQINVLLATYLAIAPCGAVFSLDRYFAKRRGMPLPANVHVMTTIATRLIQIQMCVIYLFGGIGKMRGELWWEGSAVWAAAANLEYQSVSLTWLVHQPWLIALLTHLTVFWETFYPVLIWPRLTRPIFLAMAVAVHGGIAIFLGMPTFGLVMLIGNLAFVPPEMMELFVNLLRGKRQFTEIQAAIPSPRAASQASSRESNRYTVSI
ncbi:MAG: HTTM domain-containing protein [Pirellulaceae bacterium]